MRCARCDWRPSTQDSDSPARQQLEEHSEASGHPLCGCCGRSLDVDEQGTCETPRQGKDGAAVTSCLQRTRDLLAGVVTMYFEDLPQQLGQLRGTAYDNDRPGAADGRPLPGGDALVLLGPGSEGLAEDGETSRDSDTSSVAFDLAFWERTWRDARNEPRGQSHRPKVQVRQAASYLEVHARWAARNHPGFADYLDDLRLLHDRLERATGRHLRTVRAEAECFGCGADALVREITDSGFDDRWTCRRCGEAYDWPRYLLAVSGRLQESDVPGWGLPEQVAYVLGVNPKTVRTWCNRLLVPTACVVGDPRVRVWWDDARVRADKLHEDARRRADRELDMAREAS